MPGVGVSRVGIFGVLVVLSVAVVTLSRFLVGDDYVSALIVPHHNLVADYRSETFARIAPRTQGRPIILLSPNHYENGTPGIQTISGKFTTEFGDINIDNELLDAAKGQGALEASTTFEIEHGVKALLPDIAKYYPESNLLPLVISEGVDHSVSKKMIDALFASCRDCLLITSADFSHYQPYQLSELHDKLTIRGLQSLNHELLSTKAELEPMYHVSLTTYWAELHNTRKFVLDQHTNSTEVSNDFYAEGTTHIMGWFESGDKQTPEEMTSFMLTGDINLGDDLASQFHPGYRQVFSQLGGRVTWGTDLVVGGLRSSQASRAAAAAGTLEFLKFTHVLADETNVQYADITGYGQVVHMIISDNGIVNLDSIREQNAYKNIIVYVRWSDQDESLRQELARSWVDAGADLVVGIGLDSALPVELYQGKLIAYSLGNLLSDNPHSYSIALAGGFYADRVEVIPMTIANNGYKPVLQRNQSGDDMIIGLTDSIAPYLKDSRGGLRFVIPKQ